MAGSYDEYLNARLELWGWWGRRLKDGSAGWPPKTITAMIFESGVFTPTSGSKIPYQHHRLAEEVDALVLRMGSRYPSYASALKEYYFNRHLKPSEIAKKNRLSRSAFFDRIKSAKIWLSARLDCPG